MHDFANRIALITGAGSGIGKQLAKSLSAEGARIAALDRDTDLLSALAREYDGRPFASAVADVTNLDATRDAVRQLEAQLGPVDLVIANAGIGRETSALNFKAEDFTAQINVNLVGVANTVDAVLPGMIQRKRGHLVVLSSLASYRGLPMMAGYCASKAGVSALFDSLRVELTPLGIDVTTICPGWIRTRLTKDIAVPQPFMMELEYAVAQMVRAIRRRVPHFAFPSRAAWHVRVLRWLPASFSDWLIRRFLRRLARK